MTVALAAGALALSATVIGLELAHIRRRRSAGSQVPPGGRNRVAGQTLAVIREGYRETSSRENAVLNMLVAFLVTFALTRATTYLIRSGLRIGPLRNVVVGNRHIHHFVPGIGIALVAGSVSIGVRGKELDKWLAVPFGGGAALILDETALLLELEDVYWSEEGVLSLQVAFAGAALLGVAALVRHLLQRGEPALAQRAGVGRSVAAGPAAGLGS